MVEGLGVHSEDKNYAVMSAIRLNADGKGSRTEKPGQTQVRPSGIILYAIFVCS